MMEKTLSSNTLSETKIRNLHPEESFQLGKRILKDLSLLPRLGNNRNRNENSKQVNDF